MKETSLDEKIEIDLHGEREMEIFSKGCAVGKLEEKAKTEEKVLRLKEKLLEKSFRIDKDGFVIDTDAQVRRNMLGVIDEIFRDKLTK